MVKELKAGRTFGEILGWDFKTRNENLNNQLESLYEIRLNGMVVANFY